MLLCFVRMEEDIWNLFATFNDDNRTQSSDSEIYKCDACQYCGSIDVRIEDGNYICIKCGSLSDRFIDLGAEWRYYGADDNNKSVDPTRCGMPVNDLLPNSSLGSIISSKPGESMSMKLIRKHHFWNSISYKERSLYHIFDNISSNSTSHGLPPSIIEEAKALYKKMSENKVTRGENRNGMIATSIYMSCKNHKVPRSSKEIANIFNLKNTTMTRGCKKFQDIMRMNVNNTTPEDFINRFGSKINMPMEMRELCKTVMKTADDLGILSDNMPPSIAAGVMYLVITICGLNIDREELSETCGVSQVTMFKCYKKLHNHRDKILPKEIIHKYGVT